ncbi:LANO_0H01024g1_1 [Lachancea nothofagi CBS 11611]|uniref:LANO_0H01024g1_1 n=1 Tax=Lachancea nothofagi CBS 11611 TaxID=1266666 RepID=A0A1G4KKQ3_9SACH|nr:LANO_0H01024g1_1 [Lachancea nothofagi CBS 11611]
MSTKIPFEKFTEQLYRELHALSAESKRRNAEIKHASDKSQEILKVVTGFDDLTRHPDFVVPFVLSCASRNAKLTTISMQCLQKLSSVKCLPSERIEDVLNAFIDSTHLAVEIQLKVLQIIPIFFKTYDYAITGKSCSKLLQCCSSLLQQPNKAPMVVGTASATLQQLINDILDRAIIPEESPTMRVAINNTDSIEVGAFRYDANRLFFDLCNLKSGSYTSQDSILNIESISEDYGLEIIESVLNNHYKLFEECADLQFILKTRAVPLFLRSISASNNFPIVIRSARCLVVLIRQEFLKVLELELEIILFLLINILSNEIESPLWKKIIALEIFQLVSRKFDLILGIFKCYDIFPDRKQILTSLLHAFQNLLNSKEYQNYLNISPVLAKGGTSVISQDNSVAKIPLIELLDKPGPSLIDQTYVVYLILSVTNQISDGIGSYAAKIYQKESENNDPDAFKAMYSSLFAALFSLHKAFLYSSTLDTPLFHSVIRAFQKISHAAGILELNDKLNECLNLFGVAAVNGCTQSSEVLTTSSADHSVNAATAVLNTISGSLIGQGQQPKEYTDEFSWSPRSIHPRAVSVFRALVSLSISLGSSFDCQNWSNFLKTWQWMAYYFDGLSRDYEGSHHNPSIVHGSQISNSDVLAAKTSISKFCESTQYYSNQSFYKLTQSLIYQASDCLKLVESQDSSDGHAPTDGQGQLSICAYNEDFFIVQLGELSRLNITRLLKESKGRPNWNLVIEYLVDVAASRRYKNESLRLCAVDVLNEIIGTAAKESTKLDSTSGFDPEALESTLLMAMAKLTEKIVVLGRSREAVHNGFIESECDIVFQVLRTLKGLLDVFGDSLKTSWDTVFSILNSPFEVIRQNSALQSSILEEDSSILDVITSKHKGMTQVSFDVFKLIFDDFLQTLPLGVFKDVIDTLSNFVRQDRDLNISFSSISQFWLIGDYLRTCISKNDRQFTDSQTSDFVKSVEQGKLVNLIRSRSDEPNGMFYGLWLYLLKTLVECTDDPRVEVKNGAIQTFFRIVDSHSSSFPPWELIIQEVMKPLLSQRLIFEEYLKSTEFIDLTLKGLVQMYSNYFTNFSETSDFVEVWELLVQYMAELLRLPSFEISFIVLSNLQSLLKALQKVPRLPNLIVLEIYEMWGSYNMVYTDSSKSTEFKRKTNYECVEELIRCYPFLHQLLSNASLLSNEKVEKTLTLLNSAARYPLLPEFSTDSQKPSSLQQAVLESVKVFELGQSSEIELLILNQISTIVALPFETRNRIEMKLGPRLSSASKKRIPSFEAISYEVCEYLTQRLKNTSDFDAQFVTSKKLLKLLKNLSVPVACKSLIGNKQGGSAALWTISSNCFYLIADKILRALNSTEIESSVSEDIQKSFMDLFIEVAIAPLKRIDPVIDGITEACDIEEFEQYRNLLLKNLRTNFPLESHLEKYMSAVWSASFFHEVDDIEDALIRESDSLHEVAAKLANFPFDEVLGSTQEQVLLSKYKTASICLRNLMEIAKFEGLGHDRLRSVCVPFMVARYAFIMRRYISDVILLNRKPIAKDRKTEVVLVLSGLKEVLDCVARTKGAPGYDGTIQNLEVLYPLVLRTIPASHKIEGLQAIVQELSLDFTKLLR